MEAVDEAMEHRRDQDACGDKHYHPCIEGVDSGEELSTGGLWIFDRPHPSEQHGRVEERVEPPQVLEVPVAPHAPDERASDDEHCEAEMGRDAAHELRPP